MGIMFDANDWDFPSEMTKVMKKTVCNMTVGHC